MLSKLHFNNKHNIISVFYRQIVANDQIIFNTVHHKQLHTQFVDRQLKLRLRHSHLPQETRIRFAAQSSNIIKKYKQMEKDLKYRTDPVIATLDTPQFKSIFTKNLVDLVALFNKYNYEIRIAGGAVR